MGLVLLWGIGRCYTTINKIISMLSKAIINYLKENGAKIISLGKRILRAETAAIVTGGVIINEFF